MNDQGLRVRPVISRREHRAFCALPYHLYRADPNWVPPLRIAESQRWSPRHNPSLRRRWSRRFMALRGKRVVGRVAAVVDPAFASRWAPQAGFVGFFECENDLAAAQVLFAAAEAALRERGMTSAFGPVNLTTNDEVGLLVEGYERPPMLVSPYNPPYYQTLFSECGYEPNRDYHAYAWTPEHVASPAVRRLVASRARGRMASVRVRQSDPRRWSTENIQLRDLYNASFAEVWGFVPLADDEYDARSREFQRFYRPELVYFADVDDRAVGFGLALPDANQALAHAAGRLLPLGWLRIVRAMRHVRTARFILLGVLPEFAGRGIAPLIAQAIAAAAERLRFHSAELSLVQESNREVRHVIEAFGGYPIKTYRLYQRAL